jgi:tetratricopeptide (TPR) repeat protein
MLDAQLYGSGSSSGFHLTNLLWHLGSTLVLFAALTRLTGSIWPSAFAAALFAVHPLNVEPVAWVSERKGILSTFFGMLSLWAYARYAEQPELRRYLLVGLALVLGLMAKPILVTLPFVFLMLDFWPLGRLRISGASRGEGPPAWTTIRGLVLEKLPLLALSAIFSALAVITQAKGGALTSLVSLPLSSRFELATMSYLLYLKRVFCPIRLAAYYPLRIEDFRLEEALAAAALLLMVTGIVLWQARRAPYLTVGWLWFLGTLVPVLGLVQVGSQAQADRYTYLPSVGLFIAVSWCLASLGGRCHYKKWAIGPAAVMLSGLMVLSARQVRVWKNTETLWAHALAVTKNNHVAHNNLAIELQQHGDLNAALSHFELALQIKPGYTLALNGKGQCLMELGKLAEAISCFQAAVRCDPALPLSHNSLGVALAYAGEHEAAANEFGDVLRLEPENADGHLNLGRASLRVGRPKEAAAHFLAGMRLKGSETAVLPELGRAYQMSGDWQQAEACFRLLVALDPQKAVYHKELALCLSHLGLAQQATGSFRESLRLDPRWPSTDLSRAWRLATDTQPALRWGQLAVLLAEKVVEAKGQQDARSLDTLAAAYAEAGRFDEARQTAGKARDQAQATGQKVLAREIEDRLRLYEKGQPFRAP